MFTNDDREFLERLGARAHTSLARADPTREQLHAAITRLRAAVLAPDAGADGADPRGGGVVGQGVDGQGRSDQLREIGDLLDVIEWSMSAGERDRARAHAATLARAVRRLDLPGSRAMRAVDAAQQIRSLVVLAA